MKKNPPFLFLLRAAIGCLFIFAGYSKLMAPASSFTGVILGYQLVSIRIASLLAVAFPWTELIAGVFFALGLWLRPSFFILWSLNVMFLVAIVFALIRGIPIHDCGCFGEGSGAPALPIQATLGLDMALFFVFLWMNSKKEQVKYLSLDCFLSRF